MSEQKQLSSYRTLKEHIFIVFLEPLTINFLPLGVPSRNICIPAQAPATSGFRYMGGTLWTQARADSTFLIPQATHLMKTTSGPTRH